MILFCQKKNLLYFHLFQEDWEVILLVKWPIPLFNLGYHGQCHTLAQSVSIQSMLHAITPPVAVAAAAAAATMSLRQPLRQGSTRCSGPQKTPFRGAVALPRQTCSFELIYD